jgi:hypothetical protein
MVSYEDFPFKEEMKQRFKVGKYYAYSYEPTIFQEKKHNPYYRDYYYAKGKKPSSHSMGRKPQWRHTRRQQRRAKALFIFVSTFKEEENETDR